MHQHMRPSLLLAPKGVIPWFKKFQYKMKLEYAKQDSLRSPRTRRVYN